MKAWLKNMVPDFGQWQQWLQTGFCLLLLMGLWGFANKRQHSRVVGKVHIDIENSVENHFVDAEAIEAAVGKGQNNMIYMRWFDSISIRRIEQRIEKIDFVKDAQVSHDLKGNLDIQVSLVKPIARILNGGSESDRYLGNEGEILPTSEKYVSRVVTLDGPGSRKLIYRHTKPDSSIAQILHLLEYIQENPFWKAQIAHIHVDEKNELTFLPEVGDHQIEFGPPTDIEEKFKRLEIYYQKVVPVKGWNAYPRVSVKFNNQIVCQKSS